MCCGIFPSKLCLFIFCTLDAIVNLGLMIFMSTVLSSNHASDSFTGVNILVVLCTLAIFVTFSGCWGGLANSSLCLWIYTSGLAIVFIGKILLYVFVFHNLTAREEAAIAMKKSWKFQKEGNDAMDQYQYTLQCCGVEGPYDYTEHKMEIPDSCLNKTKSNNGKNIYKTGCGIALADLLDSVIYWYLVIFWICLVFDTNNGLWDKATTIVITSFGCSVLYDSITMLNSFGFSYSSSFCNFTALFLIPYYMCRLTLGPNSPTELIGFKYALSLALRYMCYK